MKKVFWEIVFSLMSFGSIAAIIAPNVPKVFYWLGWLYIVSMLGVGVLTLYAERIVAWCDKKLGINKDE
ncbi:hypothetical protein DET48_111104 [Vibrio diazotrophicus]|uniref:Uncharacterized protein n=1 Tax=Vibrio diazotrophicus TaxID=685 RepID=A0A329E8W5_VIBDI|nr:hypothetical protein [Vibrio diazotrophicus]RAS63555.1 hypothetical protein DET48_111104 [Vibrio diazotrophicus]